MVDKPLCLGVDVSKEIRLLVRLLVIIQPLEVAKDIIDGCPVHQIREELAEVESIVLMEGFRCDIIDLEG